MNEKFQNKYRNESARAQWWNYQRDGAYFITICTHNREHFFGEIESGKMNLSPIIKTLLLTIISGKRGFKISEKIRFHPLSDRINLPLRNTPDVWDMILGGKHDFTTISFATNNRFNA